MTYYKFFAEQQPLFQSAAAYLPRDNPTFQNPAFAEADFRILIVRLSPFRDVYLSTPHLFLYQAARRELPDAYLDMAFFPPVHDREQLAAAQLPYLVGSQSSRSIEEFDLVLISNSYALELVNLPYLLHHSGIPLLASARDAAWPLFILGGSNALATQALITPTGDSFVDAIFFGEGEVDVGALLQTLRASSQLPKRERMRRAAASTAALWIAGGGLEQPITKALYASPKPQDQITEYPLLNSPHAGTARLQINYGCPAFCSFCFEGYDRKPYRELPLDDILETARRLKSQHGADTLELYSFNFNTHTAILDLLLELNRIFDRVSFKSQRVDILHTTPGLLRAEVAADKRNFTLGIEGISVRQRAFLNKTLTTGEIMETLAALLRAKIREIKLFYILTGHEDEADITEFYGFMHEFRELHRRLNPGIRVVVSAGRLVRMPCTPLRHDRLFLDEDEWQPVIGPVKAACEIHGFEFRLATPWPDYAVSQVLALGGYWLHEPLRQLAKAGHCYALRLTGGYWEALRGWMQTHGQWNETFLGPKGPDYPFALDFVAGGVSPRFLYRAYQHALLGRDMGYCLGQDCLGCGACRTSAQRASLTQHRILPPTAPDYGQRLPQLMRTKWRLRPLYVKMRVPSITAGVEPAWLNAWIFRYLLRSYPALADNLLAVQESLFTTARLKSQFGSWFGETVFALKAWDVDDLLWELSGPEAAASESAYLGVAADFEPGNFRQLRLNFTLPVRQFPAAGRRLRTYLQAHYLPNNVRREGQCYRFELAQKALKKQILLAGSYRETEEAFQAELAVGPKFDLGGYLSSFGGGVGRARGVPVALSALLL
ncbi:MAG: radical SAM protein [Chloroflexota bacterium]|nr:radical SAM protein [Chloroflexota bacterium]